MTFLEAAKAAKEGQTPTFGRKQWQREVLIWDGSMLKLLVYAHYGTGTIPYQGIDYEDIIAEDWELK